MSEIQIEDFSRLEATTPYIGSRSWDGERKGWIDHHFHLLGFAFDGTTSFRPGSRFGPNAIREASMNLESYSPYLDKNLEEDINFVDLGNLPFYPSKPKYPLNYFNELTKNLNLKERNIKLVVLGGEHSISYGPILLHLHQYPDMVLLHLDAHADLRDGYLEEKFSHASIIRRVLDHFGKDHQLIQYGIRSGTREEFQFMKEKGTLKTSLSDLINELNQIPIERPIYLTLDLDFFDPAYFPGTGTPETGGEDFHTFVKIIKILARKNFVGADITELAPQLDPTGNSNCFAAKVTREILLALKK